MINGKTLILRFSSMGDVVMTIPIIRCLQKKYPENKFIFVTRPKFTPFFKEFNNVETFEIDLKKRHKGFLGLFRLFSDLRKINPKRIADLHSVLRTKIVTFLFRIFFVKVSVIDKKRKERKALIREENKIFKPLTPIHFLYQEAFNKLGFSIDLTKDHIYPPSKVFNLDTNSIDITSGKLVGIAPFAKHTAKMYPLDLMQKIVSYIQEKHTVFLFGFGKLEMETINRWSGVFKNVYSCDFLKGFENEISLISNLDLMISMDSANGHIASIYNVPVITLWGLTHPYAGFTTFNSELENQFCVDREKFPLIPNSIYGNKTIKGYENAMRSISIEEILGRVNKIIES
jgi:ADP-heptose:LPS heptosyltransferase